MTISQKQLKRRMRHQRIRAKVKGTAQCPRLSVFRSNKYTYVQLIDDEKSKTLLAVSSQEIKKSGQVKKKPVKKKPAKKKETDSTVSSRTGKVVLAFAAGKLIAKKALKKNIKKVIFDRGGYKYHGRIKAVAEGAREGGLKF